MELCNKQINVGLNVFLLLAVVAVVSSIEIGDDTPIDAEGQTWLNSLFYLPKEMRVRKEYRMLTQEERRNFHDAILKLKQDKTVKPNKYDLLVSIHGRRPSRNSAHRGTGFMPWHRIYILLMENALREQVPSVALPYWDTSLDDVLMKPRKSSLWSKDFMGNGDGFVSEGDFASWSTVLGRLYRTVGSVEGLIGDRNVSRLFEQVHVGNISKPEASYKDLEQILEELHNRVHRWVGGDMLLTETSAQDPIFYIYHPWIDLIYEKFRQHQRAHGVDPETDWATHYGQARHHRYSPMGLGNLMAIDGANEIFAENIRYEERPTCSRKDPDCGSQLLYCNVTVEKCVPWTATEYRNIQHMAEQKFMPFDYEAKLAILEKIQEGFKEIEMLNAPDTTTVKISTTSEHVDVYTIDHDHTGEADHDHSNNMTNHISHNHDHSHAGHLDSFLDKYVAMLILAALLVVRVLFCVCCKCCSTSKVRVRRTSRKYKLYGIVNVNYREDSHKARTSGRTENRPDNIYTITETCNDTSTLGQTTYVRFSRYILGSDKRGDKCNTNEENENEANRAKSIQADTNEKEGATGHNSRYVKSGKKSSSIKYRQNRDTGEAAGEPDSDPADDYMDMTFASQISQSDTQYPEDIYERETTTTDIDSDDGAAVSEVKFARLNSVENENYELPVKATENSFAFLDDYDNVDFIREAMNRDMLEEESYRLEPVEDCQTIECTGGDYNHSAHI